ncbi:uncharacterized protein CC84DRAFT_1242937 [Paraphaeosphaeria sporulosa]|uniref:Uncharacterized protein n=1 Tax=Paraphaeosphaeria sporulosa TaxID=1460663 RepID=A0A177CKA8_9PLEO|nr:uncharacterized protein CC84DRAFT_1242937 [Paraphaeosphaeria sporulosa]OAG07402.1 hypothetical protein CC84DRAFT_1242937 [Paraphaeosphaeria sporulosa]
MDKDLEKNHDHHSLHPSQGPRFYGRSPVSRWASLLGRFSFFSSHPPQRKSLQKPPSSIRSYQQASEPPGIQKLIYVAFGFGCALAVDVAILSDVGGGMFNAAFTAATCLVGLIRWDRAPYSITAQLFTSVLPSLVIWALLPGPVPFNAALDPTVSIACGLFLEMFLTAQLVLTILMLPSRGAKPLYIGKALFTAEMASVLSTGSFLNSTGSCGPTSDRLSDLRLDLLAGTWLGCCARQWSSA